MSMSAKASCRVLAMSAVACSITGAASAAEQYLRYERLFERFPQLTADEIERKLIKIRRRDGQVPRALDYPAFNLALEKLGGCEAEKCKLTKWQKLVYGFCS